MKSLKSLKLAGVAVFAAGTMSAVAATVSVAEGDDLAAKVAEARALAIAGDNAVTVEVAPGTYVLEGEIVIDSGICVKGTSTREETIVQAAVDHRAFVITAGTVSTLTVSGSTWTQGLPQDTSYNASSATSYGFGVLLTEGGTAVLTNCVVENVAVPNWRGCNNRYGGGVAMYNNSKACVTHCVVRNCSGDLNRGAGVYTWYGTLRNSIITNNTGNGMGAGVSLAVGGKIYDNLIAYNTATTGSGGGLHDTGYTWQEVYNNTVVHNVAKKAPAGFAADSADMRGCIVWGNTLSGDGSVSDIGDSNPKATFRNCCLSSDPGGKAGSANNIYSDPKFIDEANGDFRLSADSPCVDSGDAGQVSSVQPVDLDDLPRVWNGRDDGGGAIIDRGCYERNRTAYEVVLDFELTTPPGVFLDTVEGSAFVAIFSDHGRVPADATYVWDFGDGSDPLVIVGSPEATHRYAKTGAFTVTLTATSGTAEDTVSKRAVYVYDRASTMTLDVTTDDDFGTMAGVAHALMNDGATAVTLKVAPGTYPIAKEVLVDGGLRIEGTGSRDETVIQAAPDHRAFVITDGTVSTLTVRGATWTQGLPQDTTIGVNPSGDNFGYGVLLTTPGNPVLTNCVVENVAVPIATGASTRLGAGIATYNNSNALVTDCLVRNCSGNIVRGGGVYVYYGTLRNSVITNNTSNGEGTGVSVYVGGNVYNCLIAYNTATSGDCGGLREQGWTYQSMYNNTVVHNVAKKAPAGLKVAAGTFRNCIAWGNTLSDDGSTSDASGSNTGTLFYNCCLSSDPGGKAGSANNIFEDPQFIDEANGDFRLAEGSPCVDTGDASAVSATSPFDLDGLPRDFDATKTGTAVIDRGCYERNPAMYEASVDFARTSPAAIVVGAGSAFQSEFINRGKVETGATFTWDFGDGSDPVAVVGSGLAEHTYQAPGAYDVTLTATAGTASDTVTHEAIVRVYPADGVKTIHVAKTGDAVFPYATPENATPDLDRANMLLADLNALGIPAERLQVGDGEYTLTDEIVLTNGLVVASENGPEKTSVRQTTDNHRVFMVRDGMVSGFTAIGGAFVGSHVISPVTESDNNYRASGFIISARGIDATHLAVVTNCIVTGMTGSDVGGHGPVTLAGSNARMYDSVVRDIGATGIFGAGGVWLYYGGIMERCRVLNCSANEGGGVAIYVNGSMRNSLIAGCTAKNQGGGLHFNTWSGGTDLYNNTIVSNTTQKGTSGGMVIGQCSWMNFINNIVAGNYGPDGEGNIAVTDKTALGATFKNNCVPGYPAEEIAKWTNNGGNIGDDPRFEETDDPAQKWHLKRTSPCVDTGNLYSQDLKNAVDLDGKPRIHRRKIDMGCFENDGTYGLILIIR